MLTVIFVLSMLVIVASVVRRPALLWQRLALVIAVIALLAVCVAWGIEFVLQSS